MSNTTKSQLIPLNVAARWLRVPVRWLRGEAEAGRIPCLRADNQILCDFEAVQAVLLERARQSVRKEGRTHAS
ncbi:MAG: hypothetical protein ACRELG_19595 [Gemmataceae bacterium]